MTLIHTNSGADTNYAALFSGGKVGIGISNPSSQFETYASYAPAAASSQIANQFNVANSGAVSSGADITKGMYLSVARTNATGTASPTTTGHDIVVTDDAGGTSQTTGSSVSVSGGDKKILGVISTKSAFQLGGFGQDELISYRTVPLTLAGRVPVKVTLENGEIEVGDRIAPSTKAGFGRKANDGEVSIGIALEPFSNEISIDTEKVLVLVK